MRKRPSRLEAISRRFWFEHESGRRLYPYRSTERNSGRWAFRVAPPGTGANKTVNQTLLDDEEEVFRHVFGKGWSVRLCDENGKYDGLYNKDGYSIVRTSEHEASEPRSSRPFKRSIWRHDDRYDFQLSELTESDFFMVSRLASVDAAKKRTPPIPFHQILRIGKAANAMPPAAKASPKDVAGYLEAGMKSHGAGVATLICMLAVASDGGYAPMDRKVAGGLLALGEITVEEVADLTGADSGAFATVYVKKVIPFWMELRKTRSAEEADNYLGELGIPAGSSAIPG